VLTIIRLGAAFRQSRSGEMRVPAVFFCITASNYPAFFPGRVELQTCSVARRVTRTAWKPVCAHTFCPRYTRFRKRFGCIGKTSPQGLKPRTLLGICGTTEVVP
jgi:hypothetical protein